MDSHNVNRTTSFKNKQKSRGNGSSALPRRHSRRNSLQLPKGVRVLLSPRNPYEEFHKLFKDIPKDEFPINDYSCALSRDILLHGRLFVSQNWICFYSNIFGWETLVKLECKKIKSISRAKTARMFPNAILVRTEKKKYLFCSFLTRDAAHRLLSTIWQESISQRKPDSGVDELISGNGDQDEESVVEEISEFNENKIPLLAQKLQSSKDPVWNLKQPQRTVSCPNTPIVHHTSVQGEIAGNHTTKEHPVTHAIKEHYHQRKASSSSFWRKCVNGIITPVLTLLDSLYGFGCSLGWLFKRNQVSAEVFVLFSLLLLVVLLISTITFMDRVSKLEKLFNTMPLEGVPEQYQKADQLSIEYLQDLLKKQETRFHIKTERLNQALAVILLSIENVKSKLKLIKDELTGQSNAEQSKIANNNYNNNLSTSSDSKSVNPKNIF